jgi:antitoxin component of MazEF toxin-antitoxin module
MKSTYFVQPYRVGSKQGESLALVIPARLRREADITNSTILMIKIDGNTKRITVQKVNEIIEKCENMIPAVESLEATKQQVSSEVQ